MTEEQSKRFWTLLYAYGSASEELGGVPSSLYWNSAASKQTAAEQAIRDFMGTLKFESDKPKHMELQGYLADVERPSGFEPKFSQINPEELYKRQPTKFRNVRQLVTLPEGFIAVSKVMCSECKGTGDSQLPWGCTDCNNRGFHWDIV